MEPKDRIIFAADVDSIFGLHEYLSMFKGEIGVVKLGMELLTHALFTDEPVLDAIIDTTDFRVMWDLKYGDIPRTVAGAAKEVAKRGQGRILGFTVHCLAGRKALEDAVKAVKDNFEGGSDAPMVIGITLLTSLGPEDLLELGIQGTPKEVVLRLAKIASEAKVPAIVCSPEETKAVLELNPDFTVINPGIRFAGSDSDDQKRLSTPKNAIANGASYLVIGSDLRKGDPLANARRAAAEIEEGLKARG
jgi:orotidine-5'-phosphate decarboxylase